MARALVLDGHLKSALSTVRALGQKEVFVVAGAERSSAPALRSRYTKRKFVYTSPRDSQQQFITDLRQYCKKQVETTGEKLVVYCFSDATYLSVLRHYEEIKKFMVMMCPEPDKMETAFNKRSTYELAKKLNLPTIKTYEIDEKDQIDYPAVVKNAHSVVWLDDKAVSGTAVFVHDAKELNLQYEALVSGAGEAPLLQEFIKGDEYGVELMIKDGEVLLEFAHKRIRSLSPTGGAAVVKETAYDTPEVNLMKRYARMLAEELSWNGPMMVEFKIDDRTSSVKLMEVNGRFWGSLPLPQRAGVDFVGSYFDLAVSGETQNRDGFASRHLRTRHTLGDLKNLLTVLFKKDLLRQTLYPKRGRAVLDFCLEFFRSKSDVFWWNDPAPAFWEVIDVIKK